MWNEVLTCCRSILVFQLRWLVGDLMGADFVVVVVVVPTVVVADVAVNVDDVVET